MDFPLFPAFQGLALIGAVVIVRTRARLSLALATAAGATLGAMALGPILRVPRAIGGEVGLFDAGWLMAYGALGGAVLGVYAAARAQSLDVTSALDALAPALGWMVGVGRLGCAFAGCCFGAPSGAPWAWTHAPGTPAFAHVGATSLHPTALYEALVGIAMLLVCAGKRRRGLTFAFVASLYAAGRFAVDLLRADPRPMAGGLSLPQWLSLAVIAAVGWWLAQMRSASPASQNSHAVVKPRRS